MNCEQAECVLEAGHQSGHRDKDGEWYWEVIRVNDPPHPFVFPHALIEDK